MGHLILVDFLWPYVSLLTFIQELLDCGINQLRSSKRAHMPTIGYGMEGTVWASLGKERHDLSNWKACGRIAHHEYGWVEVLAVFDRAFILHDCIPFVEIRR